MMIFLLQFLLKHSTWKRIYSCPRVLQLTHELDVKQLTADLDISVEESPPPLPPPYTETRSVIALHNNSTTQRDNIL